MKLSKTNKIKKFLPYVFLSVLAFITIFIWIFIQGEAKNNPYLNISFLDVGQGDSIFIEAPNGKQILIDGGPDSKVLEKLGEVMPFGDRSIDLIIATHPDYDHINGFNFILDNYEIGAIMENGSTSETKAFLALEEKIKDLNLKKLIARRGMKIILDNEKNIYLDILYPDRDVSQLESNEGSIVARLVYNEESFMFTGDAPIYTEVLISQNELEKNIESDILKLGHHGSKYSSSLLWLKKVKPKLTIVSAGEGNRYKHPNIETLSRLKELGIPYQSTVNEGTITLKTNGLELAN